MTAASAAICGGWRWCRQQLLTRLGKIGAGRGLPSSRTPGPHARARLSADGVAEMVDTVVLSCETGSPSRTAASSNWR